MRVFLLLMFLPVSLMGQEFEHTKVWEEGMVTPPASLDSISWIAGHWRGEAMGAATEEIWSPPLGGSMMGSFKLAGPDTVMFYELMHIQQQGEHLLLQIRHFHGNLFAWEEPEETVDFAFIGMDETHAWFDGLTFERIDDKHMNVHVIIGHDSEDPEEATFEYELY